jgi:succinate dehydrogenase / fumarate reductase, membrane anchor subunit
MVNKVIVGAHYGFGSWLAQRLTAAVMAFYTLIFAVGVLLAHPTRYAAWRGLFAQGWMKFATLIFFLSLSYHAWVGMRDILMDYVKPAGLRLLFHTVVVLLLIGCAGWALQILWRV